MSEESIRRVYNRAVLKVEAACAEGRGFELLKLFVEDLARDWASTIFLRMETEIERAKTPPQIASVAAWLQEFPVSSSMSFIASIIETYTHFGFGGPTLKTLIWAAADAYQTELDRLLDRRHSVVGRA